MTEVAPPTVKQKALSTRGWIPDYMVMAGGHNWLLHEGEWYAVDETIMPLPQEPKCDE